MTIVDRQELGKQAWDAAVEASPEAWLWHRFDTCDTTIQDWPRRSDAGFAVLSDDNHVEAIVPAFLVEERRSLGLRVRFINSMGGPAIAGTLGRSRRQSVLDLVAGELTRRALEHGAVKVSLSLPPMAPAWRGTEGPRCNPLLYLGCDDSSGQTWIIDVREGTDVAWKQMEGRARTSIRKAETAGITVRPSSSIEDWRLFYDLHQSTYRRLGVLSYPAALFRTIFERLVPAGLCYVLFAELNGTPIAAINAACHKQGGYYWHGVSNDDGRNSNATTLLVWHAIKDLIEGNRIQWFDCGEAVLNSRDGKMRQLSDFKKSFGGELYPTFRGQLDGNAKTHNRLLHLKGLVSGR